MLVNQPHGAGVFAGATIAFSALLAALLLSGYLAGPVQAAPFPAAADGDNKAEAKESAATDQPSAALRKAAEQDNGQTEAPQFGDPPQPGRSEHAGHKPTSPETRQNVPAGPMMTLAELERIALQNNPTLAQAEAAIRAAEGRSKQAGLFPNPIVGYQGEEFAFRGFSDRSEHFGFIEQSVPLGGKLGKSRRVFDREVAAAEIEATAQKQRVLNTVRMLYYEALGAQQEVDLRGELAGVAAAAVKTTAELANIGQADRPDYLEAEIEQQQVELDLDAARNNLKQVWQLLASVIGSPQMEPARLAGTMEEEGPVLDLETLLASLLQQSPEMQRARVEVERAQAVLTRAQAERTPDLFLRGGIGYNNELLETTSGQPARKTGPVANVQIGFSLPIFNRNQGGIAAAQADLTIAQRELTRLELSLRIRFAEVFRDYNTLQAAVRRYREIIVPRAERAYGLYLASFKQMAASYPQVLIAQRTMFQVKESYLRAVVGLRQTAVRIQGFLLTGGLDAPRLQTPDAQVTEMPGARTGSQGTSSQLKER